MGVSAPRRVYCVSRPVHRSDRPEILKTGHEYEKGPFCPKLGRTQHRPEGRHWWRSSTRLLALRSELPRIRFVDASRSPIGRRSGWQSLPVLCYSRQTCILCGSMLHDSLMWSVHLIFFSVCAGPRLIAPFGFLASLAYSRGDDGHT